MSVDVRSERVRHGRLLLLCGALVLVGALALRLTGLDWLLPSFIEPDAYIPAQVRQMEGQPINPDLTLDLQNYPYLLAHLTTVLTPREEWNPRPERQPSELSADVDRARWPVLRVRLIIALLSLLAVPATWWLARLWLPPAWSLVAAALMATSLLALHFGAQARPHGAAVGLTALAVLACVRLRRRGDASGYAVAGLAVGLAIGCIQSGIATLIPLGVAHLGVVRQHGPRKHLLLLLPAACLALTVLAFYPFLLFSGADNDALRGDVSQATVMQGTHHLFLDRFNGAGFPLALRDLWNWEPALACGGAFGVLVWLATLRRPTALAAAPGARLVVLAYVVPYALVVGLYQLNYERFLLPLVPFLSLLSAWGVARTCELVPAPAARRVLAGVLGTLLLGFPALVAVRHALARQAPSTIELAAAWVREHVPERGKRVVVSRSLGLPLHRTPQSRCLDGERVVTDRGLGWHSYEKKVLREAALAPAWHLLWIPYASLEDLRADLACGPAEWVDKLPADLCVNEVYDRGLSALPLVTEALRDHSELLARLSPDADPSDWEVPLTYQDLSMGRVRYFPARGQGPSATPPPANDPALVPAMAWRVLHAERFGPVIEIFRIPHADGRRRLR